jgi:hypothetical protein
MWPSRRNLGSRFGVKSENSEVSGSPTYSSAAPGGASAQGSEATTVQTAVRERRSRRYTEGGGGTVIGGIVGADMEALAWLSRF